MAAEDDAQRQHQLTQAQLEAIENEIKSTQPLTSPLLPIGALAQQYAADEEKGFLRAADFLSEKYASFRRVRGDGNCYYRAFLYSLCECLLRRRIAGGGGEDGTAGDEEFFRIKEFLSGSLKWVCQYGYDEYTIDMFHEELVELFEFIAAVTKKCVVGASNSEDDLLETSLRQLHSKLNEENSVSDYCTWFLRVLTAARMKSDPDRYLPFVMAENYADVPSFCGREVEPMGKECGMVQVSALAECLGVRVVVEYMDGRMTEDGGLANHVFGEGEGGGGGDDAGGGGRTSVTLLYRPGHYDILY